MTPLDTEGSEEPRDPKEPKEPKEPTTREKLTKKASVVFERKVSDGNSFWSLSARNSVVSMFESSSGTEQGEAVASQNPRKILQKKRSSLSHQPDIERALEKKASQESLPVHEFQKVMSFILILINLSDYPDLRLLSKLTQSSMMITMRGIQ